MWNANIQGWHQSERRLGGDRRCTAPLVDSPQGSTGYRQSDNKHKSLLYQKMRQMFLTFLYDDLVISSASSDASLPVLRTTGRNVSLCLSISANNNRWQRHVVSRRPITSVHLPDGKFCGEVYDVKWTQQWPRSSHMTLGNYTISTTSTAC